MEQHFQKPCRKHEQRIDRRFEQDGIRQGRIIEAVQEWHLVGDKHCFTDYQCACRRDEETSVLNKVVGEKKPFGEQDQVESDKEE